MWRWHQRVRQERVLFAQEQRATELKEWERMFEERKTGKRMLKHFVDTFLSFASAKFSYTHIFGKIYTHIMLNVCGFKVEYLVFHFKPISLTTHI